MEKRKEVPLQGRFDLSGGVLKIDRPCPVNRSGEPTPIFTEPGNLHIEIMVELGLLRELGRRFDAGADIGDQYGDVVGRLKRKFILSEDLAPKK